MRSFFLFPLVYIFFDIVVRYPFLKLYSSWQLWFYSLSVLSSALFFILCAFVLNKLKKRKIIFFPLITFFSFYFALSILGSYIFYYFNGFFPNYYTLEYFVNEPLSAFVLLKDSVKPLDAIVFVLGVSVIFAILFWLSNKKTKANPLKWFLAGSAIYVALFSVIVVKIKKYDQVLIVDTNLSAVIYRHVFDWESERKFKGKGLAARNAISIGKTSEKRDFNVLVVVFESLRKQNLGVYGYRRNTTPNLKKFQDEFSDEFFVFKNPYTVSTTTMLAVPAILTGIGPYQDLDILYSQPIIWDFGNMLNYRTFFLSSHSLKWYRFDRFYAKENLDHKWSMEESGFPFYNDLGINDIHTINHLNEQIGEKKREPFFGVVQLNTTHYPYTVPDQFAKWSGTFVDEYDNAILYQDHLIGKLLNELKKKGKLENTIIVFTSDHGESLKDHNNIGHVDSYYAETISIPLMLYVPKRIGEQHDIETLKKNLSRNTSNIDIAPTILELLGLGSNKKVQEISKNYTGQSLYKLIDPKRSVIIMNNNGIARFRVGLSVVRDNLHYIYRTNVAPNRREVYDIKKDPKETNDIIRKLEKHKLKELTDCFDQYPVCEKFISRKL